MRKAVVLLAVVVLSACTDDHESKRLAATSMTLSSPAFANGGVIPKQYTCDGAGISPPLRIDRVPPSAKSLALIVQDPDAPGATFTHWLVWNIKPDQRTIEEGRVPAGAQEGTNDFGKAGWGAPCPPSGTHRYVFHLYAVDQTLETGPRESDVDESVAAHKIAQAQLVGTYRR